jgi:hypothetical protein
MAENRIRPIAFYLPQFYPNPENDKWWGKGFTEWTMVAKAKPLFTEHYQPHIPADLGFYDLRLTEVMEEQTKLAREYGIYGFMFYHYWFQGKRLLQLPVNQLMKQKNIDFPFCLCWANETWSRVWVGNPKEILMPQEYSIEDDIRHMEYLCREVFTDDRYIKVNGKPIFGVWEVKELPDAGKTAEVWQQVAIKEGFKGIYLINVDHLSHASDPRTINFDAVAEFVPDWGNLPPHRTRNTFDKILNFLKIFRSPFYDHKIMNYDDLIRINLEKTNPSYKYFPGVTPSWDNTSRRKEGNAHVFHDSSPEKFEKWIDEVIKNYSPQSEDENFIFINAWNEWAEGAHLEPCIRWGSGYLEALKRSLEK